MKPELKPCPFCGGEAKIHIKNQRFDGCYFTENWEIFCATCGGGFKGTKFTSKFERGLDGECMFESDGYIEAITAWNRRTDK